LIAYCAQPRTTVPDHRWRLSYSRGLQRVWRDFSCQNQIGPNDLHQNQQSSAQAINPIRAIAVLVKGSTLRLGFLL
jgi:hypothetical protein